MNLSKIKQMLEKKTGKWRWTITIQMYLGLTIYVFLIFMASFLGWSSLQEMNDIQKTITQRSIPEFSLAINIGQQSVDLTNMAPKLLVADTEEDVAKVRQLINRSEEDLSLILEQIQEAKAHNPHISGNIKEQIIGLIDNLEKLEASVMSGLRLKKEANSLVGEALSAARDIDRILLTEIDNSTFFIYTGWEKINQKSPTPVSVRYKGKFLDYYRSLLSLKAQVQLASNLLNEAHRLTDADHIQPLRERFRGALRNCKHSLNLIDNKEFKAIIVPKINLLDNVGFGDEKGYRGFFKLLEKIFNEKQTQKQFITRNQNIVLALSSQTQKLIKGIQAAGGETVGLFEESVGKKRNQLLVLNIISVFLALFSAWFFVGKYFIGRIKQLSRSMLTMAKGNLEIPLKIKGNDEVTDMAEALEIFRKYAVEAQQMDLVKKLADEVHEKNSALEDTISKLKSAQKQMILQEKLASLGQLTSGIAHEIKNPLNFINNFSGVSKELLEDISKEIFEEKNKLSSDSRSFIEDTLKDLHENLDRINTHGQRANDIIKCMLQHSRGQSGEKEIVDLNRFVNSSVNLAYQGKRSTNADFNVDIQTKYGDNLKEIEINAQDISRVILNLVSNACDAIEDKIQKLSNEQKKEYTPCIWISTEKKEGETVVITVKDNGPGVPEKLAQKIFDPFFTTKSTDKGTGLGLSLSHDIILKHGGKLHLKHLEEGSEFVIELPLKSEQNEQNEIDDDNDEMAIDKRVNDDQKPEANTADV